MKKLFLLPLALGSVLLSSCQDEDFGYESSKIAYEKTMSQMLGEVAPDQTWVNAEQGYVTISEECQNVKVFDGLTGKVIANYDNLRPGSKVYYNSTIGYNPTISNGAVAMEVKNGQNVSFMAAGGSVVPQIEVGDSYVHDFSLDLIEKDIFRDIAPKQSSNFEFVAKSTSENAYATFEVYPLYWNTDDQLTVGLYYYDPVTNEVKTCPTPIFQNRSANSESGILQNLKSGKANNTKVDDNWENIGDIADSRKCYNNGNWDNWAGAYRVKAIRITVPANLVFGFYVQSNDGIKYYANPELNKTCTDGDVCHHGKHATEYYGTSGYAKNFMVWDSQQRKYVDEPLYLGLSADHDDKQKMELHTSTDKSPKIYDSRNIYLAIKQVSVLNYEAQSYTLCFEDLGATGIKDMDFNDCVLKLNCVNGLNQATVSLLAAGGILPINVSYNGTAIWSEIHAALGTDLVPVNANKHNAGETTDVVSVADKDLPTAEISLPTEANWTIQHVVSLFNLSVKRADGTYNKVSIPTNPGQYPMGFAVAGDFKWPGEQQNIIGTYPDFATWAANSGLSYWYPWSAE